MSLLHRYRDLGEAKPVEIIPVEEVVEASTEEKLEAFESGYKAGWEDAVKAQADAVAQVSTELGQNLQDMSFTYHEALSKLTVSMQPILVDIVDKLLPSVASASLGPRINEQLMELMKQNPGNNVEIVVSPSNVDLVTNLADTSLDEPFHVIGEPSLGEGQAFVRIGSLERGIDLDAAVSTINDAIAAFFHETEQETSNG